MLTTALQTRTIPVPPRRYDGVVFVSDGSSTSHDALGKLSLAAWLARLLDVDVFVPGSEVAGSGRRRSKHPYYVPCEALSASGATDLGVGSWRDLYGGVVAQPFLATKVVTHGLVAPNALAPAAWTAAFADRTRFAVLDGYSVFTRAAARSAARQLLAGGSVRVKDVNASGGLGQSVISDLDDLEEVLATMPDSEPWADGLVLERNLQRVRTLSVGQVRVGGYQLAYHGHQRITTNHSGQQVYGGSSLRVVQGGFDALLRSDMDPELRTGVQQAFIYHRAAMSCLPGVYASRSNYNVAQGVDDSGTWRSGVLEQSWRIGGASGAEIAALHAFEKDPTLAWVNASTHEVYAHDMMLPAGAEIHFNGVDPAAGRLVKYSTVDACGDV